MAVAILLKKESKNKKCTDLINADCVGYTSSPATRELPLEGKPVFIQPRIETVGDGVLDRPYPYAPTPIYKCIYSIYNPIYNIVTPASFSAPPQNSTDFATGECP